MICKNVSQNWEYLLFDILLPVEVKYLHLKPRFSVKSGQRLLYFVKKKKSKIFFPAQIFYLFGWPSWFSIEQNGAGPPLPTTSLSCYQDFNKPQTQRTLFSAAFNLDRKWVICRKIERRERESKLGFGNRQRFYCSVNFPLLTLRRTRLEMKMWGRH